VASHAEHKNPFKFEPEKKRQSKEQTKVAPKEEPSYSHLLPERKSKRKKTDKIVQPMFYSRPNKFSGHFDDGDLRIESEMMQQVIPEIPLLPSLPSAPQRPPEPPDLHTIFKPPQTQVISTSKFNSSSFLKRLNQRS
jgi:hypothetical protein